MMRNYFVCFFLFLFLSQCTIAQTAAAYFKSGVQKDKAGDHAGAIEDFTKSIALDATRYQTFNNRGIAKSDMGDLKGALADYNQAIALNPKIADIYNNRGNIKDKLKDYNGAVKDYSTAIN
jgi:tetratricopeptide (TPR) repeat protein